jgi:hypothetical protein
MYRDPSRNWDYDEAAVKGGDRTSGVLCADHERPRSMYGTSGNQANRLLHRTCNQQRGDGSRDDQRPALSGINPEDLVDTELGALVCAWP